MSLVYVVNPKRRKARKHRAKAKRRAPRRKSHAVAVAAPAAPKRRRSRHAAAPKARRYKRNPRFSLNGVTRNVTSLLVPAAIQAGGAVAVDVALAYVPLPDRLKTGYLRHVTRAAASVGLGLLVSMVKKDIGKQVMSGGLTVALYGAMREGLQKVAPSVQLADLEDDDLGDFANDLNALLVDERSRGGFEGLGSFAAPVTIGNASDDSTDNGLYL